jgi:proteasome-associated ATPase
VAQRNRKKNNKEEVGENMPSDRETELLEALEVAQSEMQLLQNELAMFLSEPLIHATVINAKNEIDPEAFAFDDLVAVVDETGNHGKTGRLIPISGSNIVENGYVHVMFPNLTKGKYAIGINGRKPQVKLLGKNDVNVFGVFGKKFAPGQAVKVNFKTKQIVDAEGLHGAGDISSVKTLVDDQHIEVEIDGRKRIVFNGMEDDLEIGDRVQLDSSQTVAIRHLTRENEGRYACDEDINVPWNSIGGCEDAKKALKELVEMPFMNPEIYQFYNKKPPKGGLLYGPPGCGKTLIAKAAYTSLCKQFGKDAMSSGWIYVKGPELLNCWLGNTEENIRNLFHQGRQHYKKTGYPAVMFIDEAEAILGVRGKHSGSDFERTAVPMFLSEMDGLGESKVVVLLATNRPDTLDSAVIRHGRIDRHIKVSRPTLQTAADIFKIHLRGVPLADSDANKLSALITAEMFSSHYTLYKVNGQKDVKPHFFTLKDAINGAMIAGVVEQAVSMAMERDIHKSSKKGVYVEDFKNAVERVYKGQVDQNHQFDIEDFLETNKLPKCGLEVEKMVA